MSQLTGKVAVITGGGGGIGGATSRRFVEEGAKEDVAPSLLSKIKEDLPSKVEEATEKQENK